MARMRILAWGAALLVGLALLLALALEGRKEAARPVRSHGEALVGGPFRLTSHMGEAVTDETFRGRFMLIFFGFTYCPDVCPTELQRMALVLEALGPRAEAIVPLFVTIDPERDTPEVMARYVKHFDPRIIGLTGDEAAIRHVTEAYRVYARKTTLPGSAMGYTMDHSSYLYLMDPQGGFVDFFTSEDPPRAIAEAIAAAL